MNINIREHIISNFSESNSEDIIEAITQSINDNDEITLPGLGVFFEILWVNSSDDDKKHIVDILNKNLKKSE